MSNYFTKPSPSGRDESSGAWLLIGPSVDWCALTYPGLTKHYFRLNVVKSVIETEEKLYDPYIFPTCDPSICYFSYL